MSISSHKSTSKKIRPVQSPQRANGKLRVAAILEAAAAIIDEKGYELTTMAEIAARSGTKIGSLYRFFPNKESLADTIVVTARKNVDEVFDQFDAQVRTLSIGDLADSLTALLFDLFTRPAFMELLGAGHDWSVKREQFRSAMHNRIANTLMEHSANLEKKLVCDIALMILINTKAVATHQKLRDPATSALFKEFREMIRLYLQSKLDPPLSRKIGLK